MAVNEILALLNTGRFKEAQNFIESLDHRSFDYYFGMLEFYRIQVMTEKYYELFKQIDSKWEEFDDLQHFLLEVSYFATQLVTEANDITQRNDQIDALLERLNDLTLPKEQKVIFQVALTNLRGVVSIYAGLYLNALNIYAEAERYCEDIPEEEQMRSVMGNIAKKYTAVAYTRLGRFNQGLDLVQELIKRYKDQGNLLEHARAHILHGEILGHMGKIAEGIRTLEKGLELIKQFELPENDEAKCRLHLARLLYARGDYNKSISCLDMAQKVFEKNHDVKYLADCYGMIGKIYFERGSLDLALDAFQKNLAMQIKLGHQLNVSLASKDIAMINYAKKKEDNYPVFIEKALERSKEVGNPTLVSELLYYLITFQPKPSDKQQAFLNELKLLADAHPSLQLVKNRYLLSKAFVLANSSRIIDKYAAQQLYFECLERPEMTSDMLFTTYLNLFELLVLELKISHGESEEVMEDINRISEKIDEFLKSTGSIVVKLKLMILQSKFLLLEHRIDEAQDLLKEGKELAEKQEFFHLKDQIVKEREGINQYVSKWLEIIRKNKDNIERIQKQQIIEYLQEASKIVELF